MKSCLMLNFQFLATTTSLENNSRSANDAPITDFLVSPKCWYIVTLNSVEKVIAFLKRYVTKVDKVSWPVVRAFNRAFALSLESLRADAMFDSGVQSSTTN